MKQKENNLAAAYREKALKLLVGEEKIVLMATHDPILALMGNKRIVINNGGIVDVIKISSEEKELLRKFKFVDNRLYKLREGLRYGDKLSSFSIYEASKGETVFG